MARNDTNRTDPIRPSGDTLRDYYADIARYSRLSPEAERETARLALAGNVEARNRLVEANLPLAIHFARSYGARGVDFADLVQAGNLGMIFAAEKFDPDRGFRFSTYASYWIRRYCRQAIIEQAPTIRLPNYTYDSVAAFRRIEDELHEKNRREPTDEEIGSELSAEGYNPQLVERARRILGRHVAPVELAAGTVSDGRDPAEKRIDDLELTSFCLSRLPGRLRYAVEEKYLAGRTLADIGKDLGLSRERVRQLLLQARALIRDALGVESGRNGTSPREH